MKFPRRFGRGLVYRRFIKGRSVLVWPYLLHYPEHLKSLVQYLQARDHDVRLYATWRDRQEWEASMGRFRDRATPTKDLEDLEADFSRVDAALEWAKSTGTLRCVRLIGPRPRDVALLSDLTGRSPEDIRASSLEKVYATTEVARIRSRGLGLLFFSIKPFLPAAFRRLNRRSFGLKRIFYR
jgi:hypothetical protein